MTEFDSSYVEFIAKTVEQSLMVVLNEHYSKKEISKKGMWSLARLHSVINRDFIVDGQEVYLEKLCDLMNNYRELIDLIIINAYKNESMRYIYEEILSPLGFRFTEDDKIPDTDNTFLVQRYDLNGDLI